MMPEPRGTAGLNGKPDSLLAFRVGILEAQLHERLAAAKLEDAHRLFPASARTSPGSAVAHQAVQSRVLAVTMERRGIPAEHESTVIELSLKLLSAQPGQILDILKDELLGRFRGKLQAKILAAVSDITGHIEGRKQLLTRSQEERKPSEQRKNAETLTTTQRASITKKIVYLAAAQPITPSDPRLKTIRDTLQKKGATISAPQIDALRSWVTMRIRTFLDATKATLPREDMPRIVHAICKAAKPFIADAKIANTHNLEPLLKVAIEECAGLASPRKVERAVNILINVYKPNSFRVNGLTQDEIERLWSA